MTRRALFLTAIGLLCCTVSGLRAENAVGIGSGSADAGANVSLPLTVSGDEAIQGFVMVFEWAAGRGTGVEIVARDGAGEPLEGAEMVVGRVADNFMVFSVVMDVDGQDPQVIPAGDDTEVGTATIRCASNAVGNVTTQVTHVDEKHARVDGGPELTNLIVSNALSITDEEGLVHKSGSFTCRGEPGGDVPPAFACGGSLDDNGNPVNASGKHETTQTVTFYYRSSELIQGLSMAVTYDCALTAIEDSLDISGGVLEETNAEFVHIDVDNESRGTDGDGCEFIFGALVDANAEFDGRTLPATSNYRKLFSLGFTIEDDAMCDHCLWLKFSDGLDGNGTPPVKNLVSVDFFSKKPEMTDCQVCVEGEPQFIRGDCNFSGEAFWGVNIADAAAMVGYFFLVGDAKFNAPCDDACDANDDGRLDAADVVFVLEYLFVPNRPEPPAPGPLIPGEDEDDSDDLGCEGGPTKC